MRFYKDYLSKHNPKSPAGARKLLEQARIAEIENIKASIQGLSSLYGTGALPATESVGAEIEKLLQRKSILEDMSTKSYISYLTYNDFGNLHDYYSNAGKKYGELLEEGLTKESEKFKFCYNIANRAYAELDNLNYEEKAQIFATRFAENGSTEFPVETFDNYAKQLYAQTNAQGSNLAQTPEE